MIKCLSNNQCDVVVNSAHWQAISVVIGQFLLVFFSLLSKHLSSELVKKIGTTANVLPRLTQISKLTRNTSTKKANTSFYSVSTLIESYFSTYPVLGRSLKSSINYTSLHKQSQQSFETSQSLRTESNLSSRYQSKDVSSDNAW